MRAMGKDLRQLALVYTERVTGQKSVRCKTVKLVENDDVFELICKRD